MERGLVLDGIAVSYGGHALLTDVDLAVEPGAVVALLGPSGSGKSSLLRVVAGLLPADRGDVRWDGESLARVPTHRRGFGLVFQDAMLFPHLDVGGNVAYGLAALPRAERRTRVEELLALVDLPGYARRSVATLSGGEAQRVALARALAPRPRLLLLDEPFGALDRELRDRLAGDVRDLLHALATPAIHVTHDVTEAELVADRTVRLVPATAPVTAGAPTSAAGARTLAP
ncbi:MAG TPA: ATP-binding cassette domain-containing protein [Actinomycetes bacterium]|nr:ATP-binding cassette domain-containing protein [Actinomycetes bacterium]